MLSVRNLRKEFNKFVAVDDVSFEVNPGEVFGLLGPNGAGKTTTIRMIMDIIQPDRGTVSFFDRSFSEETKNHVGYLPEERGLYRKNKVLNTLLYFADLKNVEKNTARERAVQWLKKFDLIEYADKKCEELSKGMQQKLQFISTILHDPELLILDEPFTGLDPINQILLKDIFAELRRKGKTIIFSTHQMEQVEKLCDNICLINHGKTVEKGELREIKKKYGKNSVHLEFDGDGSFLKSLPFVSRAEVYENYAEIQLKNSDVRPGDILKTLMPKLEIRKFEIVEPSLNAIFIDLVGENKLVEKEGLPPGALAGRTGPVRVSPDQDPKVKKALQRLILSMLFVFAFGIYSFFTARIERVQNWLYLFGGLILLSFIQWIRAKKQAGEGHE